MRIFKFLIIFFSLISLAYAQPFGGAFSPESPSSAYQIFTNKNRFVGLLGASDITVQQALETLSYIKTSATTINSKWNFANGNIVLPQAATLGTPCTEGQVGYDTDAASGQRIYVCESGTWTLQGDGGGGGSGDITDVGDCTTGACFNGASGTQIVFNNAGGDGTLVYDGTQISWDKDLQVSGTGDVLWLGDGTNQPAIVFDQAGTQGIFDNGDVRVAGGANSNVTVTSTQGTNTSTRNQITLTYSNSSTGQAIGLNSTATNPGTTGGGTSGSIGVKGTGVSSNASGTQVASYGLYGAVTKSGAGTVTSAYSLYGEAPTVSAGAITNIYALGLADAMILTGSRDAIQASILANATQTSNVFQIFQSDGSTNLFSVSGAGNVTTAGTVNKVTITAPAAGSTLTIADGKTLTVTNTVNLNTMTDGKWCSYTGSGTALNCNNDAPENITINGASTLDVALNESAPSIPASGLGVKWQTTGSNPTQVSAYAAVSTSSVLAGVLSDETGSGAAVFGTSPTITSPTVSTSIALPADAVDAITEIASSIKTGADSKLVTGTAGGNGNCAQWNVDGDIVDSGAGCGGGSGDSIIVNGSAVSDAAFNESNPSTPSSGLSVKWQTTGSSPTSVSAYAAVSTSSILAGVLSDETGSSGGVAVFSSTPTIVSPVITRLSNLTSDGVVKTTLSNGTLSTGTIAGIDMDSNTKVVSFGITIDGGGSAITTGVKGYIEIPFAMTITGWTALADQSGSIVVDIFKDTYANFPPTVADTIAGTEKPTITTATKGQDLTLTTWTTSVTAGDIIGFNVDSITTVTRVHIIIRGNKT